MLSSKQSEQERLKEEIHGKEGLQPTSQRKSYILEIEEEDKIKKLTLEEGQICWEGFRKVGGKLIRGVPKRSSKDCWKYCCHEGCDPL